MLNPLQKCTRIVDGAVENTPVLHVRRGLHADIGAAVDALTAVVAGEASTKTAVRFLGDESRTRFREH